MMAKFSESSYLPVGASSPELADASSARIPPCDFSDIMAIEVKSSLSQEELLSRATPFSALNSTR